MNKKLLILFFALASITPDIQSRRGGGGGFRGGGHHGGGGHRGGFGGGFGRGGYGYGGFGGGGFGFGFGRGYGYGWPYYGGYGYGPYDYPYDNWYWRRPLYTEPVITRPVKKDDMGYTYWEITNNTPHTITVRTRGDSKKIPSGKTKKLRHRYNFTLSVHGPGGKRETFETEEHHIDVHLDEQGNVAIDS